MAYTIVKDANATFFTDGVDSGDIVEMINSNGETEQYVVEEVISEDMLKLTTALSTESYTMDTEYYSYRVVKELDRTAQAKAIADVSRSLGYLRCINIWPCTVIQDGVELPSYYLACTVAGMAAGLPSHQGFTRISVAGIERLKYSNDYFNQDQLDIIAEGGTFIFTQSNPSAAPVVRHQLTTDMSAIEFQEFSFVKNFDYVSKLCQEVLDRFLGTYNITEETLVTLTTALRALLESLRLSTVAKIGAPVRGFDITSVKQLDDNRTRVEIYAEVDFPYPLNTIGLHLISR